MFVWKGTFLMEMLQFYLTLLTFLPWIFIYVIRMIRSLNNPDYHSFSKNYIKKHFFELFRMDTFLIILFFFFFASFKLEFVNQYLFPVMCLYLCVNSFYEVKEKRNKDFFKENFWNIVLLILFMFVPILIFIWFGALGITYKIMLFYLFFFYFLIVIACQITSFFKKIFKRK